MNLATPAQTYLKIAPGLHEPLVALETTVISHGLPHPYNLETALALEETVRQHGATPATIALFDGKIKVGLDHVDLEKLAISKDVVKVSRRDLALVLNKKQTGATTVAATMICANLAGIRVFATGGIGGVHRGATTTLDISADLPELAQTPVIVVCAGAKAILDLPLTLEYLETLGVPVIGYGTDELPAFYTPQSGLRLEARADSPAEVAQIARTKWDLGLQGGLLVTVPPPVTEALPPARIEQAINNALAAAERLQIRGKATTPFLLDWIRQETEGASLEANIALLKNNAEVAAQIAVELAKLDK
jgi:pseudouridine-5'-phosphate glycosidase